MMSKFSSVQSNAMLSSKLRQDLKIVEKVQEATSGGSQNGALSRHKISIISKPGSVSTLNKGNFSDKMMFSPKQPKQSTLKDQREAFRKQINTIIMADTKTHKQQKIREAVEEEKEIGKKFFGGEGYTAETFALPEELNRFDSGQPRFVVKKRL